MLQRYLTLWLCLSSALAYVWPRLTAWLGFTDAVDPFVIGGKSLPWAIALAMFAIGWMLPRDEVIQVVRRWPTVLGGTAVQYLTMPALALAVGWLFGFRGDMLVGIIMVGCVPGAMASNVLTLAARGNASYSVSLTTCATLLSPLLVPLALAVTLRTDRSVSIDPIEVSINLALTVVLPVVTGHLLGRSFSPWEKTARWIGSTVANLAILWIIAVVVGCNRANLGGDCLMLIVPLLLVNLGGYAAGFGAAGLMRLPDPMRRALTLEIGMQNAGLGATLASQLFPGHPSTAIAPALYTFGCMLTGTVLARLWAMRTAAEREAVEEGGQA